MNFLENCLLLAVLPTGLILAGYWLAYRLQNASAAERLATSALTGLGLLLWSVASLNFFKPLNGFWAWLCIWPIVLTVLIPTARQSLTHDLIAVAGNRRGVAAATLAAALLVLILWPLLSTPSLVFYDGTSNHDSFFWISAAEHLKRHTYMELPAVSAFHPLTNATPAIIGWRPVWGRMGAEGLLAFASSVVGLAPVKLYLTSTATLLIPWIAAVFLAIRTFLVGRLSPLATLALVSLQPIFVFFQGNANLPNLLGALSAAGLVIATERALRRERGTAVWLILIGLSLHGLLCCYPEMLPFAILPAGLLWLRSWFKTEPRAAWFPAALVGTAWCAGAVINPASSIRALTGFIASFDTARANQNWANLFDSLSISEYIPALATLSVGASKSLGPYMGTFLSLALTAGFILVLRRAIDRMGAVCILAGAGALLVYTLATGFNYGWQKTVQFGGTFWAAFFPVAVLDVFVRSEITRPRLRLLARGLAVVLTLFFAYATVFNCLDGHKWSQRKTITQDWFSLREFARDQLSGVPILVESASFRMAFFHGMWATYFLSDSPLYFADRGRENGGYLRDSVNHESKVTLPTIGGYLVSRDWADTFDANSGSWLLGDTVALLKTSNRVMSWGGLYPENGYPENADGRITIDVRPHSPSHLLLTLAPRNPDKATTRLWRGSLQVEGESTSLLEFAGPPPWRIVMPMVAGKLNHLELLADSIPEPDRAPPFIVSGIKIETTKP